MVNLRMSYEPQVEPFKQTFKLSTMLMGYDYLLHNLRCVRCNIGRLNQLFFSSFFSSSHFSTCVNCITPTNWLANAVNSTMHMVARELQKPAAFVDTTQLVPQTFNCQTEFNFKSKQIRIFASCCFFYSLSFLLVVLKNNLNKKQINP